MAMKIWQVSNSSLAAQESSTFIKALDMFGASHTETLAIKYPLASSVNITERFNQISTADLVIAEVSVASTGSGIDLGLAFAGGKDIIAFHQGTSVISPVIPKIVTALHTYITLEDILKVLNILA